MFKIIALSLVVSSLFGVQMSVKKADVLVSINTQELSMHKGEKKELKEGTTLCYINGKGKVVIPALKKQLKKSGRCLVTPLSSSTAQSYASSIKDMATIAFWDSSESVRHGAGTKGETEFDSSKPFVLNKGQKELLIYGKEFGPLPVVVTLKDAKGNEIMSFENDESETTIVHIGKNKLKTGMSVEIYNGFEELMLSKKVMVKN